MQSKLAIDASLLNSLHLKIVVKLVHNSHSVVSHFSADDQSEVLNVTDTCLGGNVNDRLVELAIQIRVLFESLPDDGLHLVRASFEHLITNCTPLEVDDDVYPTGSVLGDGSVD